VMIFKHSLVCPTSSLAFREYERYVAEHGSDDGVVHALIEIQNARPVSNAVAEKTGVRHESPQALLLRGGEAVWHESHSS
ncbi:MAG: bacillithiol system redox-active protein YtxJ, partial [Actinobacteria bacterium]|nr:bacillithiol system redox-active protein YtxJ [Actinomycetota bacterium]NIS28580.1 bacillithiol system redox-active protein YtxJ [Actinomycetota bacterium]NIW25846.1 bacillithiol system redox-active protein YtxJ [Actinomycetota bacterium]